MISIVSLKLSLNNLILSVSDSFEKVLWWVTPSMLGYKGNKRKTVTAAKRVGLYAGEKLLKEGRDSVILKFKGMGPARIAVLKSLEKTGVKILALHNQTSIPHNGCRPPKKKRL